MKKFLIIQTAFIGDVVLATPIIEKLHTFYPDAQIDFLLRKGNENLLTNHPFITNLLIWDKKKNKKKNLLKIIKQVRNNNYNYIINLQRFTSTGIITAFSGAKTKIGFDKNPLSFLFTKSIKHQIGNGKHEVERNIELISDLTDNSSCKPKLYPSTNDFEYTAQYKLQPYICIAPTSVWFTKQYPKNKWVDLIKQFDTKLFVYLIGGPDDKDACNEIINQCNRENIINLCGKLSFLQTSALMKDATMNFVNDSAPMHIASAINAPTTAIFCSTIPAFGFGPLADNSKIVETKEQLDCRPCGLHGFRNCPKEHFKCANTITTESLLI